MLVLLTICDALSIVLSCLHTLASHLGMLDKLREGYDVELNPKIVLVDLYQRWKE